MFDGKYLIHAYWGARLRGGIPSDYLNDLKFRCLSGLDMSPVCSSGTVPLEYSTYGGADSRIPALDAKYADGSLVTVLHYADHEIIPGKPALDGLPATYTEEGDKVETLVIRLEGLDACALYKCGESILPGDYLMNRGVAYLNQFEHNSEIMMFKKI